MKGIIVGIILTTMLLSCTTTQPSSRSTETLPRPKNSVSSLVIGAFFIEFPEGYTVGPVTLAAHTLYSYGVRLYFRNVTQNYDFSVEVQSSGYFYFVSNGTDDYHLKGFGYKKQIDKTIISIMGEINTDISNNPASVIYLGHSLFKFSNPGTGRQVQTLEADWNRIPMLKHFYSICKEGNCAWMGFRVIECRFEVMDEYKGAVMHYPALYPSSQHLKDPGELHIDPEYKPPWFHW
jgi:hypothetical protein